MYGYSEKENQNGKSDSVAEALSAGGDQDIRITEIGVPIKIKIMGEEINIGSKSKFFLELMRQKIIEASIKAEKRNAEIKKNLEVQRDIITNSIKALQKKDGQIEQIMLSMFDLALSDAEDREEQIKEKRKQAIRVYKGMLPELGKIAKEADKMIEKQYEPLQHQDMMDIENWAPIIQLLFYDQKKPEWWASHDGWPEQEALENVLPYNRIYKEMTEDEIRLLFDIFLQKNDSASVRGIFFRLAGLPETGISNKENSTA